MFCTRCGKHLSANERFCTHCGMQIADPHESALVSSMPDLSPTEHNPTVGAIALPGGLSHPLDSLATDPVIGNRHSNQVGRVAPDESQLANLTGSTGARCTGCGHVNPPDSVLCEACGGSVSSSGVSEIRDPDVSEGSGNEAPVATELRLAASPSTSDNQAVASVAPPPPSPLGSAAAPKAGSGNSEFELYRIPNVTLYEPRFKNVGRGNKRATIKSWKKSHFDELIISSKRVILANNGSRERQLSIDPNLATSVRNELQDRSGFASFTFKSDTKEGVRFIFGIRDRQFYFRQIPLPARLRWVLTLLAMLFSLILSPAITIFGSLIVMVILYVLIMRGVPIPWSALVFSVVDGREAFKRKTNPLHNAVFQISAGRPRQMRIEVRSDEERRMALSILGPMVEQVESAFSRDHQ